MTPPFEAHQVVVPLPQQFFQVHLADHAAIAHEQHSLQGEPLPQIGQHFPHRGHVQAVAFPDMMGDRPSSHQHQTDDHLHVLRFAVAAVTMLGQALRPFAFEVGARDVVKHQVRLQAEQITRLLVQLDFDLALGRQQAVEGCVPGLELAEVDLYATTLLPVRHKTPPLPIAHPGGLEPRTGHVRSWGR